MKGRQTRLNLPSEGEHTVLRILFAAGSSRVNNSSEDEAQDDHDSIPPGADEPDDLAEYVEDSRREFVPEGLAPLDLVIACRFEPVGPV